MQIKIGEDMETKVEMYGHAILRLKEIEHLSTTLCEKMGIMMCLSHIVITEKAMEK